MNSSYGNLVIQISCLPKFKITANIERDHSQLVKEQNYISLLPKCLVSLSTLYLYKSSLYRQKIIAKNEEIYDERFGRSTSVTVYEHNSDTLEDGGNETQE